MSLPILPISTGLITASLATIFALASVKPAQAHHSVTIDGQRYWCYGETHSAGANNLCALTNNNLITLPADLFGELSNLTRIRLDNNNLSSVPESLFSGLSNLQEIDLSKNNLSSVPESLFSGLTNLLYVSLNNNNLSSVPVFSFLRGLSNLSSINLRNNNLSCKPAVPLGTSLVLDNNNLPICRPNTPMWSSSRTYLNLYLKKLTSVSAGLFSDFFNLLDLNLSQNNLSSVPGNLFSYLANSNLRLVNLSDNNLSSVPEDLFNQLPNLLWIYLSQNNLSNLPADLFDDLSKLQSVMLSNNNLRTIPENLFDDLTSLRHIHLANNSLSSMPADLFNGLTNLQTIGLDTNSLSSVPEDLFSGLTNLQEIGLGANGFTSVPENLFSSLSNLQRIDLSSNNLSTVPVTLFLKDGLSNLWNINLRNNPLSCKPLVYNQWVALYLDNNALPTCRPCSMEATSCLLRGKNLGGVPENLFSGLSNLQKIDLADNRLSSVPADLFSDLTNLQVIYLNKNSLSSVPEGLFSGLSKLRYIYLGNNSLSSLPKGLFSRLTNLQTINLSGNSLSSVPANIFNGLRSLRYLDLRGNPMPCKPVLPPYVYLQIDNPTNLRTCTSSGTGARSSQINVSPSNDQFISIPLDQDGTSQITINLSDYFYHLFDNNLILPYTDTEELARNLTYTASSSNEEAVMVSVADSYLTITPLQLGTSIVTVNLTGTGQLSENVRSLSHESLAGTFNVVVYSTEATVPMNLIPDQNITTPMTINLSNYFNSFLDHQFISMNPDSMSASLIYTANSSNRTAVTVSIDDSLLTLNPVGSGTSTVTVNLTSTGQLPAAYPVVSRRSIARTFNVTANINNTVDSNLGITEINEQVLPSILDKVTSRQVAAITDRLDSISSASYPLTESSMDTISMENVVTDVAHYLAGRHQQLHTGTFHWDWKQALSGLNFSFPLPEANLSQATTPLEQATAASLFSNPSLWGSVDYYSIEDQFDTMTLDGDLLSFYLGMDVQPRHDMVTGMLVNVNQFGSALQQIDGLRQDDHYDVYLTTFSPYFSWFASDHLSLWASAAYGRGEAVLSNSSLNTSTGVHTSKGAFSGFSLGGRLLLAQRNNSSFALLFDGSTSSFLDVDLQRARLAAQASRSFYLNSGGSIDTSLDLALLMGSAAASVAELAGSFSWTPSAQSDLTASFSGRTLLFGGQQRGWGIDADIYFSPGENDEGFSISVAPSLGITTPQFTGLHSIDFLLTSDMDFTNQLPEAHLNAEMAYGLRTTNALFTPYSNVSFSPSTSSYSAGLRYDMATSLEIDLRATHQKRSSSHHNAVLLQLSTDL